MFSVLDMHYYCRILTEPKNALIPQYQMLFGMDKVELKFTQVGVSPESEALLEKFKQSLHKRAFFGDLRH